jgi:molybdate transport system substrate-binding protein
VRTPAAARLGLLAAYVILALAAATGQGAEIHVMTSGAFTAALNELAPRYERETGDRLNIAYGASMGATPTAIPARLGRGEPADVVILARVGLDGLVRDGKVTKGTETDLVRSLIGLAIKDGAPVPDISTVEGLKRVLLAAKSIAISDSASGVYIQNEMLDNMGIAVQVKPKTTVIPGTPVGLNVARGEMEIGFQQISELLPVKGIRIVGPIPAPAQRVTFFSAGIAMHTKEGAAARRLIEYLASPKAWDEIRRSGLEPASDRRGQQQRQ